MYSTVYQIVVSIHEDMFWDCRRNHKDVIPTDALYDSLRSRERQNADRGRLIFKGISVQNIL